MIIADYHWTHGLAILPEVLLVILLFTVLITDLFLPKDQKRNLGIITTIGLFLTIVAALLVSRPEVVQGEPLIFGGMLRADLLGFAFRLLVMFAAAITAMLSVDSESLGGRVDFYALLVGATLGMSFMTWSTNLIMLYLALETTSIVGYVMAGYLRLDKLSGEAGLKYFVYGALTSTLMLYGFSLLYGYTGETNLYLLAEAITKGGSGLLVPSLVAMMMIAIGLGFKISMVPFHFWAPDVYQGAPTPVTAFISTASKAAAFVVVVRMFLITFEVNGTYNWLPVLVAISAVTMTVGNLLAITQSNIKRLLAYSSIAHAGYALIGVVAINQQPAGQTLGIAATSFYLGTYVVTNLLAFGAIIIYSRAIGSDEIKDFAQMHRRSPTLALAMMVGFLSLAGMPPFAGFFAKFFVFAAAVQQPGLIWLAVVGVLNSIIGLYYYLIVLKVVYVGPPPEQPLEQVPVPATAGLALGLLGVGVLLLGTLPQTWFNWAMQAVQSLF